MNPVHPQSTEILAGLPLRVLTPVNVTRRFRAFRSGRLETWQAESRDGVWRYDRLELPGTPWMTVHLPTSTEGDWYGTLDAAREATADGRALEYVERLLAARSHPDRTEDGGLTR